MPTGGSPGCRVCRADLPVQPEQRKSPKRHLALIALIALASPVPAEDVAPDMGLGTTVKKVRASLTALGCEVRKAEMEDGRIEVYLVRGGQMGEVYADPQIGAVTTRDLK